MTNADEPTTNKCANCGTQSESPAKFCGECGGTLAQRLEPTRAVQPAQPAPNYDVPRQAAGPGWYPDPYNAYVQRYWDGQAWTAQSPLRPYVAATPQKSVGIAILLTFIFPGLGHVYIGMNEKGMPYLIANIVAFVISLLFFIFLPLALILWLVTLIINLMSISDDTNRVNAELSSGVRQ